MWTWDCKVVIAEASSDYNGQLFGGMPDAPYASTLIDTKE